MSANFEWDDPNKLFVQVERMLRSKGDSIRAIPDRAIRRGVVELTALVQAKMPKVTSTLVRSVAFVVNKISEDMLEGKVGSPLAYARFVEEGTGLYGPNRRPIIITAKNRKALFWGAYNEQGKPLMATRVVNPGMKARAPFATAVAEFIPRYTEIIQEELGSVAA